jgi:hypothetical protein
MTSTETPAASAHPAKVYPLDRFLTLTGDAMPYPLDSLTNLSEFVCSRCTVLAERRRIISPEDLTCDPKPMQIILKGFGYLAQAPLLRILLLHFTCKTKRYDEVLHLLDVLRRDVQKMFISLESSLRQVLLCGGGGGGGQQEDVVSRYEKIASFSLALRHINDRRVARLRFSPNAPRPALLVLPSSISVAGYGLYVRGVIHGTDVVVAGYAGEQEDCNGDASGYRMSVGKGVVVDAKTERCLCSMMNDPRRSVFASNMRFRPSRSGVVARTLRTVRDEELFVSYGGSFSWDIQETAAASCRQLAPDFVHIFQTGNLPQLPG